MIKIKVLLMASTLLMAFNSLAIQYNTDTTTSTSGGSSGGSSGGTSGGCPGGVSDCSPPPTPDLPIPSKDTAFNNTPDDPIQFGVRDVEITADGNCRVGSQVGPYAKSPCEKVYGAKNAASPSSSSSSSSSDTSAVIKSR